jgi:hypothetical protein
MRDAFGVSKRAVLGREMYTSNDPADPGFNTRVSAIQSEYGKWESMHGDKRRVTPIGPVHVKSAKDQDRWLKEMDVHSADPVRRAQMQYAAKNNLDYPIKVKAKKRKKQLVRKDAFGVSKAKNPFSLLRRTKNPLGGGPGAQLAPGKSIAFKPKKPAAPAGNFVHYDPGLRAQQQRGAMKATMR